VVVRGLLLAGGRLGFFWWMQKVGMGICCFFGLLGGIASLTWISEVRFCMIAQMSLVSLSVKLAPLPVPGVLAALVSSMVDVGWMGG
jgi:hypothetical protein